VLSCSLLSRSRTARRLPLGLPLPLVCRLQVVVNALLDKSAQAAFKWRGILLEPLVP
jgi:hypothetical protein